MITTRFEKSACLAAAALMLSFGNAYAADTVSASTSGTEQSAAHTAGAETIIAASGRPSNLQKTSSSITVQGIDKPAKHRGL